MSSKKTQEANRKIYEAQEWLTLNRGYIHAWQHYKGGVYKITSVVLDTQTGEAAFLYNRISGPGFDPMEEASITYCRPVKEWKEEVVTDTNLIPQPRFKRVREVTRKEWVDV